jgi:hypothetical protein
MIDGDPVGVGPCHQRVPRLSRAFGLCQIIGVEIGSGIDLVAQIAGRKNHQAPAIALTVAV